MHLHSTSMFVLDHILEIDALKCLQINNDVAGPPLSQMITYFRKTQESGRSLLIRGSFTSDEMKFLIDNLDDDGCMTQDLVELAALLPVELEIDSEQLRTSECLCNGMALARRDTAQQAVRMRMQRQSCCNCALTC